MRQKASSPLSWEDVVIVSGFALSLPNDNVSRKTAKKTKRKLIEIKDNLEVNAGERCLFYGLPTAGKSVLLNTVYHSPVLSYTTVEYPVAGTKANPSVLMVDLHPPVLHHLSASKNILLPFPKTTLRIKHKLIELMHRFDLESKKDVRSSSLSHSELIKIQLIRASLLLPQLLLVDDIDLIFTKVDKETVWPIFSMIIENGGSVAASAATLLKGFDRYYEIDLNGSVNLLG